MDVSILTPSFNQAEWLLDNLASVASQTHTNLEHIVMDGGSTDGSIQLLEAANERTRWISTPDRGQSHALNKALDLSSGEFIGWINSDDAYADTRAVEQAVAIFRADSEVGVVYGHSLVISESNRSLHVAWAPKNADRFLNLNTFFLQPSAFLRRSVIEDYLVDESLNYVMDRDLWYRLRNKTEFRRLNMIVGCDRHQPSRKVLQAAYFEEDEAYSQSRGLREDSTLFRAAKKGSKIGARWAGARLAWSLGSRLQPAFPIIVPNRSKSLADQLFATRASLVKDAQGKRQPLDH